MFHWFSIVQNTRGDALPGWQVECVELADAQTVVPIFADENSTPIASVSSVTNRAVADESGNYGFFVPSGTYSLRFYNSAGVFQRLQRYIPMYGADQSNSDNLASNEPGLGAALVGALGAGTVQSALDARPTTAALAAPNGSSLSGFQQSGTGAVARPAEVKLRERVTATDFGTTGAKIAQAIAAHQTVTFPAGTYTNTDTAVTLPLNNVARFEAGATLTNSGTGTFTNVGTVIREGYNPDNWPGWTTQFSDENFEGFSADIGDYGPRSFSGFNTPSAISGSINVPANAVLFPHANGISGWAKNHSTGTSGVAIYGQADRQADDALVWGLNTRTIDNGFGGLNVWGYELNINCDNVTTTALGLDLVGGSTVEPNLSVAVNVQAIGVFATPKKRWTYGLRTVDAGAIVGIELGAQAEANNSPSQVFRMNYMTGAGTPATGFVAQIDGSGNAVFTGGTGGTIFALKTPASTQNNIQLLGDGVGFFGANPQGRRTLAAAATDAATTQALANSLRQALIDLGLGA